MNQPRPAESALRTRSYRYTAPRPPGRDLAGLPGLEIMKRVQSGDIAAPPIANTLDFTLAAVDTGFAAFEGDPAEWMYNPLGTVHGGWMATLLDSALGCAVHSALPPSTTYTTATLELKFIRAVTESTGRVRAEAKVVHVGGKIATAEARLFAIDGGKLLATATTTCAVLGV
jgi:uncharacterized protein (TIGR00369 family)